ncbi:DUF2975 domain-containing protein [Amedibacillus sp. YH-ame6]
MWNSDKSLTLSILCVKIFFIIGIIFCIGGYPFTKAYIDYVQKPNAFYTILITGYVCLFLAFFIFALLHKLLKNIQNDVVFEEENTRHLRRLSWLCMGVAIVCAISSIGYIAFFLVSIAFAFIALILRVVKNVISEATLLKQENDFTI